MSTPWEGKTLVLNANFIPLNLMPPSVITWQEAIILLYQDKAVGVEFYDKIVHSPSMSMKVPSVVATKKFKYFEKFAKLTKENIKVRDNYICQYCNKKHSKGSLTVDHVLPKSHGGKSTWENLTTACKPCNASKGNNGKLKPKRKPFKPTYYQLVKNKYEHEKLVNDNWKKYIIKNDSK